MSSKSTRPKKLFELLQRDQSSALFTEKEINEEMIKKIKKFKYIKDKEFVILFNKVDENMKQDAFCPPSQISIKVPFVDKNKNIDRSTLYSFNGPFQLLQVDIGNLEFLGNSTADPKYCLLFVDLFTSKVYVYPMKNRKSIEKKMEAFYNDVESKRKGQRIMLQTDLDLGRRKYLI